MPATSSRASRGQASGRYTLASVVFAALVLTHGNAEAQIKITKARIGCLRVQQSGNLTPLVAKTCDGKMTCSFKAPTEAAYKKAGVYAATRDFCSQAMHITYQCKGGDAQSTSRRSSVRRGVRSKRASTAAYET